MIKYLCTFAAVLIIAALFVIGCNKETENSPIISYTPERVTFENSHEADVDLGGQVLHPAVLTSEITNRLDQAWANSFVQSEVGHFPDYAFERKYSYIIEAQYVPASTTDTFFV